MPPAPNIPDFVHSMWEYTAKRDLGYRPPGNSSPHPNTPRQQYTLQVLALTFSTVSVASAVLAFYWFRKMRRNFRHDLIMFLIQSDMFKALWFMIYPIVVFIRGSPVLSTETFCKVNGFFIALGVEASDFAVLMIAIHTALYIFRPRGRPGEGGLYPYRHIAFVFWIIFPLLMASLAFINQETPYVSAGTYCYLPVRPFWYRLALSWIPRYIIFITIFVIYASLYLYLQYKFRYFTDRDDARPPFGSQDSTEPHEWGERKKRIPKKLPPTPVLAYNGLIAESVNGSILAPGARKYSASTIDSCNSKIARPEIAEAGTSRSSWARPSFTNDHQPFPDDSGNVSAAFAGQEDIPPASSLTPPSQQTPSTRTSWTTFAARYHSGASTPKHSTMGVLAFLRIQPRHPTAFSVGTASTPISQLELVNSRGENLVVSEIMRTREKIRRQNRYLFIYPLVYIGMWVLPFISHVLQYNDEYALNPPYVLSCFTTVILTSQCAVDCWVFSTREKPWRHIPGSKGGFWESFVFWRGGARISKQKKGPGKSRAEMIAEARAAYRRRDEEMAAHRSEAEGSNVSVDGSQRGRRGERSWWDEDLNYDGAMSPVIEEESFDPLETVAQSLSSHRAEQATQEERPGVIVPNERPLAGP